MHDPVRVRRGELVRIYLVNILEYDPINSFHLHGNFFDYYPTGTRLEPAEFTDTVVQAQGQRGICEVRFPHPGRYMFHAHKTEFADLGWMGFFDVVERLDEPMSLRAGRAQQGPRPARCRCGRSWLLAVVAVIAAALAALAVFGGQTLPERAGPPVEELAVERTVLAPGIDRAGRAQHRAGPGAGRAGRSSTTPTSTSPAATSRSAGWAPTTLRAALPVADRPALPGLDAHLHRAGDRARDPGGGRRPRSRSRRSSG